jgi:hypothetical protein
VKIYIVTNEFSGKVLAFPTENAAKDGMRTWDGYYTSTHVEVPSGREALCQVFNQTILLTQPDSILGSTRYEVKNGRLREMKGSADNGP